MKKEKKQAGRPFWKTWLIVLGVMLLVAVLIGLALGSSFEVEQSQVVKARPAEVHKYVSTFKPWQKRLTEELRKQDPTVEVTVSGPEQGAGATLEFSGEQIGEGRVEIVRADPDEGVWYEGSIRGTEVRGSITYERTEEGTKLVTRTEGDLPPVIGGYARALIEDQLDQALRQALENLKNEVE